VTSVLCIHCRLVAVCSPALPSATFHPLADQEAGVLDRPSCLAALAALRHTKWFQVCKTLVARSYPEKDCRLQRLPNDDCTLTREDSYCANLVWEGTSLHNKSVNHTCCKPGHQTPQGEHLVYGT